MKARALGAMVMLVEAPKGVSVESPPHPCGPSQQHFKIVLHCLCVTDEGPCASLQESLSLTLGVR